MTSEFRVQSPEPNIKPNERRGEGRKRTTPPRTGCGMEGGGGKGVQDWDYFDATGLVCRGKRQKVVK